MRAERDASLEQLGVLETEQASLNQQLADLETSNGELTEQISTLESEQSSIAEQLSALEAEKGTLEASMVSERDSLQGEVIELSAMVGDLEGQLGCLLYTSPSPRDRTRSRMPSSA